LLGVVLFAPFAVQVTLGQDFLPNRIGIASGVTLGLAVSAGGVAAPLFGLLADTYGLTAALSAITVFPAAACALTIGLGDPRPRSGRDRAPDLTGHDDAYLPRPGKTAAGPDH
jgi:MFS transporter, FSR family, fosmidomycin resistance protein